MSEAVVENVIAQLDALPHANSWVQLDSVDNEVAVLGNAQGLVRLATLLLRCSLDTPAAREYRSCGLANRDLQGLAWPGSSMLLTSVALLQERPAFSPPPIEKTRDRFALVGCALVVLVLGFVFFMGLGVVTGLIPIVKGFQ